MKTIFLQIISEEKQRILNLHNKSKYQKNFLLEQRVADLPKVEPSNQESVGGMSNSNLSKDLRFAPLYNPSGQKGEPVNQGPAGDANRKMGVVGGMNDPLVKNFYEKAPSCIQKLIKGTEDLNPGKTNFITYQTKDGKSGVQVKLSNGQTGLYCMNPNIYYSSSIKQWGGWKCNGDNIEGIKGTFSTDVEDTIKSLSNLSVTNPSGSSGAAATDSNKTTSIKNAAGSTPIKTKLQTTQNSLNNAGFSVGEKGADGFMGSDTLTAINKLISSYSQLSKTSTTQTKDNERPN